MDVIKIKLKGTLLYWTKGNIILSAGHKKESLSFDLDLVPLELRKEIIRDAEVFNYIEIIKDKGPTETVFEVPDDSSNNPDQIESVTISEEVVEDSNIEEFEITEEDRENARLVLSNRLSVIKNIIKVLPYNEASKQRLAVLFEEEQFGQNRLGLLNTFESVFLAI